MAGILRAIFQPDGGYIRGRCILLIGMGIISRELSMELNSIRI